MAKQLPKRDLENVGLGVTGACVALVTLVVAALIFMVAQKGLSAFVKDGVSVVEFFTGTKWDLANTAENGLPYTGALPLIVTSFAVMVLSTLIALPIAIGSAIFAVEISPKFGSKIFQPLIELLTGIPSVVFGLIGFHVVVGLMKSVFHVSTGLGILPGAIVLAVMILPTMTTLSVDGLRAVPGRLRPRGRNQKDPDEGRIKGQLRSGGYARMKRRAPTRMALPGQHRDPCGCIDPAAARCPARGPGKGGRISEWGRADRLCAQRRGGAGRDG